MNPNILKLQTILKSQNKNAYLITNIKDIRFLTNFSGSTAFVAILHGEVQFFTDGRYEEQVKDEVNEQINITILDRYDKLFKDILPKFASIIVQNSCTVDIYSKLISNGVDVTIDNDDTLKRLRMIKNENEIKLIKNQYDLAGRAFLESLNDFQFGKKEEDWAATLEFNMRKLGAKSPSFETIVASGIRGSMPHGTASSKVISQNDPVIIDFGSADGYTSDYTRMVYRSTDKFVLEIIDIVRVALLKAIDSVKPNISCAYLDDVARSYITSKGYGEYFNHSLGHGVGLDVHEYPVLNKVSDFYTEENQIFTIEPGIYLPGKFGVRLEETILVKNGGAEILSGKLGKHVY